MYEINGIELREDRKFRWLMHIRYDLQDSVKYLSLLFYRDFANAQKGFRLPESDANDAVTCCIVCDIDQDGINEILIGTYGQVVTNLPAFIYCRKKIVTYNCIHMEAKLLKVWQIIRNNNVKETQIFLSFLGCSGLQMDTEDFRVDPLSHCLTAMPCTVTSLLWCNGRWYISADCYDINWNSYSSGKRLYLLPHIYFCSILLEPYIIFFWGKSNSCPSYCRLASSPTFLVIETYCKVQIVNVYNLLKSLK